MWDALWCNGKVATMTEGAPFGLIERGAIAVQDGLIAWVGAEAALPGAPAVCAHTVHDLSGRLLTPGLVDCHDHARPLDHGRDAAPTGPAVPAPWREDRARHQLQPGQLAHLLADDDDE